jgi:hypothetical protein
MPRGAKPGERRGGRQAGTPNKITADIRAAAQSFLADPDGQRQLLEQYKAGALNPAILAMFYHYAYGKPKDTLLVEGQMPRFEVVFKDDVSND